MTNTIDRATPGLFTFQKFQVCTALQRYANYYFRKEYSKFFVSYGLNFIMKIHGNTPYLLDKNISIKRSEYIQNNVKRRHIGVKSFEQDVSAVSTGTLNKSKKNTLSDFCTRIECLCDSIPIDYNDVQTITDKNMSGDTRKVRFKDDIILQNPKSNRKNKKKYTVNKTLQDKEYCFKGPCDHLRRCSRQDDCKCDEKYAKGDTKKLKLEKCKDDVCLKGICAKNPDFLCKCIERKKKIVPNDCTNVTCRTGPKQYEEPVTESNTTIGKLQKKIACLCHKYLKKLKETDTAEIAELNSSSCDQGVCREALRANNFSFECKCVKKECSDESCIVHNKYAEGYNKMRTLFKDKFHKIKTKYEETTDHLQTPTYQNKHDQTGEPVMEMKINTIDMSMLNRSEVKDKVITLGSLKSKRNTCTCPSHNQIISSFKDHDASCPRGPCSKKFKNKKIDCRCLRKRIYECGEGKCNQDSAGATHFQNMKSESLAMTNRNNIPLFELHLNSKNMSVLNAEDLNKNLAELKKSDKMKGGVCSSGICRDSLGDKNKKIICTCRRGQDELSCSNATCLDIKEVVVTKSMLMKLCEMCKKRKKEKRKEKSKSENWSSQQQHVRRRKSKRQFDTNSVTKWCRGLLCTQSQELQKNNGLKLSFDKKHIPMCDCKECKKRKPIVKKPISTNKKECAGDCLKNKPGYNGERCMCCKCKENPSLLLRCGSFICSSFSNLRRRRVYTVSRPTAPQNKTTKSNKAVVVQEPRVKEIKKVSKPVNKKIDESTCLCHHECQCNIINEKKSSKEKQYKQKLEEKKRRQRRKKPTPKKKPKKVDNWELKEKERDKQRLEHEREMNKSEKKRKLDARMKETMAMDKQLGKQVKKKEMLEHKKKLKREKQELKELEALAANNREQIEETSCLADLFLGIFKIVIGIVKTALFVLFKFITEPKVSIKYTKLRIMDPVGTYMRVKRWGLNKWRIKKLQMQRTIHGSETMTVFCDTFKDTVCYEALADKGKTKAERNKWEAEKKRRQNRIRKRDAQAVFSCRHTLLTTLRRTPCLWFYHVCPTYYPQCLSLVIFMRNFCNMMMFLAAVCVWTPCILLFELCRAAMCCFLCTG